MIQYDIIHPQSPIDGVKTEDCFVARDYIGSHMGQGYIITSVKPHLFPDCPNNIFFSLKANSVSEYGLLGAILGRAATLRSRFPANEPVRIYTVIPGEKSASQQEFYRHNEFDLSITEDIMSIVPPAVAPQKMPHEWEIKQTPLQSAYDRINMLNRFAANDVTNISPSMLMSVINAPHSCQIGIIVSGKIAGELIMAGSDDSCEVIGMYVDINYRRQGIGQALLNCAMEKMKQERVNKFYFRTISASQPQRRLIAHFNPKLVETVSILPSKRYDR